MAEKQLTNQEKSLIHREHPEYSYYKGRRNVWGNVYYVGDNTVSAHLVDTGDGLILIDTLYPPSVHVLIQSIWECGYNPADIKIILHTHVHLDHIGGTKPLVDMFGCKTIMSRVDAELLENDSPVTMLQYDCYSPLSYTRKFIVDEKLEDGDIVRLGNTEIECVACPGHTPGNMSFFFKAHNGDETLNVGIDSAGGCTTVAFDVLERLGLPFSLREDFVESARRLMDKKVDICLGTHPFIGDTTGRLAGITPEHNPFIDPTMWRKSMESSVASFEAMAEREAHGEKMWQW